MTRPSWFSLNAGASNWLWLTMFVLVLDQYTKHLIIENFELFERLVVTPMLEIMRLHNQGAAFSFLSDATGWQRWLFTALGVGVSIGILIWLRRLKPHGQHLLAAGLALVMGGALGNVTDRVLFGYVVDFIRVHYEDWYFPAFNVADSAITCGAALLILDNILEFSRAKTAGAAAKDTPPADN